MSYTRSFKKLSNAKQLGVFLIAATLAWAAGLPSFINVASAAALESVSDTIVSSATSTATNHTFRFTTDTALTAGQTITIQLDPATSAFTLPAITDADFAGETGLTIVGVCAGAADEVTVASTANPDIITFTVCAGDTVPLGAKVIPTTGSPITNPATVGSYVVRIVSGSNSADTRVAILQGVTMSASVLTSLTFTITGVASSTALVGGQTTSTTTTATGIGFGTLDVGDDEIGAQLLTVSTNAYNGYSVTVVASGPLLSNTGADIDYFENNIPPAVPAAWSAPTAVLANEDTYGHFGVTSDDPVLTAGNPFVGGTLYTGDIAPNNPLEVMFYNAAVAGANRNLEPVGVGTTTVAYRIQISSLQEAATDYANTLTYVCTPVF